MNHTAQGAAGLLEEDRRAVRELLDELVEHSDREDAIRAELLQRVEKELDLHARIRQEVIYPVLERSGGGDEATRALHRSEENHALERMLMPDLKRTEPGTPEFSARIRMFREMVEQHARADDEAMSAQARALLSPSQLDELEQRIADRREQLR